MEHSGSTSEVFPLESEPSGEELRHEQRKQRWEHQINNDILGYSIITLHSLIHCRTVGCADSLHGGHICVSQLSIDVETLKMWVLWWRNQKREMRN
jgi:hypothetical protein